MNREFIMDEKKISVIVPCYNVAPYIERCVASLIRQTYQNLEIILVNDGSTDNTREICERLKETDSRIKVVQKENGGLSDARNVGIEAAAGEFYSFIDGDDFIESDTYEALIAEMKDSSVSMVAGGFIVTDIQGNKTVSVCPKRMYLSKEEAFVDLFGRKRYISQSSCNKLFRKELFQNIRYKKGIFNEDMEILPRLLDVSDHVVILNKPIYHYIKKPGSITSSEYSMKRFEATKIEEDIVRLCKEKYKKLIPYATFYELDCYHGMLQNLRECSNRSEFKKQEKIIKFKIFRTAIICCQWRAIRKLYFESIKEIVLSVLFG